MNLSDKIPHDFRGQRSNDGAAAFEFQSRQSKINVEKRMKYNEVWLLSTLTSSEKSPLNFLTTPTQLHYFSLAYFPSRLIRPTTVEPIYRHQRPRSYTWEFCWLTFCINNAIWHADDVQCKSVRDVSFSSKEAVLRKSEVSVWIEPTSSVSQTYLSSYLQWPLYGPTGDRIPYLRPAKPVGGQPVSILCGTQMTLVS